MYCRECAVTVNDTVDTLYNRFMYPEGIKAMAEAVQMIAEVHLKQKQGKCFFYSTKYKRNENYSSAKNYLFFFEIRLE